MGRRLGAAVEWSASLSARFEAGCTKQQAPRFLRTADGLCTPPAPRRLHLQAALLSMALALVGLVTVAGPAVGGFAAKPQGTIVFASNRSGNYELYSIRADGTRLGQLTRSVADETYARFSPDGRRIVFVREEKGTHDLWLMNADGSHARRLSSYGFAPAWSPDSQRIAYTALRPSRANLSMIFVADLRGRSRVLVRGRNQSPTWSPDGTQIAFSREIITTGSSRTELHVVGSNGRGLRTIRRKIFYGGMLDWSAQGLITYVTSRGIEAIRGDGRGHRRLIRGLGARGFGWSADGKRFAFINQKGRLLIASVSGGHVRDITPTKSRLEEFAWSPDGRWIAIRSRPARAKYADILVVATNGSSSRRITSRDPKPWGSENLVPTWRPRGATAVRLGRAPVRVLPSESFSRRAFEPPKPGKIIGLAADGSRAAVVTEFDDRCASVEVWQQARPRVVRLQAPCSPIAPSAREGTDGAAVAGTRVAWRHLDGGNTLEMFLRTTLLAKPRPITIASGFLNDGVYGTFASPPVGNDSLLAFTVGRRCEAGREGGDPNDQCPPGRTNGDVIDATVWRYGGQTRCPGGTGSCTLVAHASGDLTVLAVTAGRIAARTDTGVRLLTADGALVRDFPVKAAAAALSGTRLALRTTDAVEVYATGSGQLLDRFPVGEAARLDDLEGDLLLTASGPTLTIRSLRDSRTTTVQTSGAARGQLEPPGLFAAGSRRVTFTRMSDVLRRLGG
jgi:Tol biopolymer transport system component